jgi:hypothetical protein
MAQTHEKIRIQERTGQFRCFDSRKTDLNLIIVATDQAVRNDHRDLKCIDRESVVGRQLQMSRSI